MAQLTGTTDTFDLIGLAEDVEDIINDISPTDTPFYTMAKKKKATAVLHQWQTDALAAAAANRAIEGRHLTTSPTFSQFQSHFTLQYALYASWPQT